MKSREPLSVLIVDDSAVYRRIVEKVVSGIPCASVVATAADGREAIACVEKYNPDVVLLDVEMPVMNGLEALEILKRNDPKLSVLVLSGMGDAQRTMRALSLGALDFIVKPAEGGGRILRESLVKAFKVIEHRTPGRGGPVRTPTSAPAERRRARTARPSAQVAAQRGLHGPDSLIVIGISTGGPAALERLVPALPAALASPVLIVQHMPAGFTESLAQSLDHKSPLRVSEAKPGDGLASGCVLIAPGGRHMAIAPVSGGGCEVVIQDEPARNECRPSVDVLFDSVAQHYRGRVLAAVLTGMGHDGLDGVRKLHEGGAHCLAQDERSCVVYGMPRCIVEAGLADEIVALDAIAPQLVAFDAGSVAGGTR